MTVNELNRGQSEAKDDLQWEREHTLTRYENDPVLKQYLGTTVPTDVIEPPD